MKEFARKVASGVAPVLGTIVAISLLRASGLPFPPALEVEAWAQWAVFTAVVSAATSLCLYTADRLFNDDI